jgi:hypothetical protein
MKTCIHKLSGRGFWLAVLLSGFAAAAPVGAHGAPIAVNDDVVLTGSTSVTFSPLDNDSDPNGFSLTIDSVSQPGLGNVTWTDSTVTYTPNINFKSFAGADSFTYTVDDGFETATAEIIVGNPFYLQKGNFAGTLTNSGGGYVTLTTTASGGFTGKLRLGSTGASYSMHGTFATDGTWSGTVGGLALSLQFDVNELTGLAFGEYNITGTYDSNDFTIYHALYNSSTNPAPEAGKYTLLLPAVSGTDPTVPSGTGFATITVTEAGSVSIAGILADGTPFSDGVYITGGANGLSNNFPLYVSLGYNIPGSLTGSLTFEDIPGVSDFDGSLAWLKPAQTGNPKLYPNGFSTSLAAVGSRYTEPPLGTLALNLAVTSPNASILLTEPDFPVSVYHQLFISRSSTAGTDHVLVANPGADALTLSINASSGAFTGSFIDPLTASQVSIKGALLHKQTRAAGFFLSPTQSGNAAIWP